MLLNPNRVIVRTLPDTYHLNDITKTIKSSSDQSVLSQYTKLESDYPTHDNDLLLKVSKFYNELAKVSEFNKLLVGRLGLKPLPTKTSKMSQATYDKKMNNRTLRTLSGHLFTTKSLRIIQDAYNKVFNDYLSTKDIKFLMTLFIQRAIFNNCHLGISHDLRKEQYGYDNIEEMHHLLSLCYVEMSYVTDGTENKVRKGKKSPFSSSQMCRFRLTEDRYQLICQKLPYLLEFVHNVVAQVLKTNPKNQLSELQIESEATITRVINCRSIVVGAYKLCDESTRVKVLKELIELASAKGLDITKDNQTYVGSVVTSRTGRVFEILGGVQMASKWFKKLNYSNNHYNDPVIMSTSKDTYYNYDLASSQPNIILHFHNKLVELGYIENSELPALEKYTTDKEYRDTYFKVYDITIGSGKKLGLATMFGAEASHCPGSTTKKILKTTNKINQWKYDPLYRDITGFYKVFAQYIRDHLIDENGILFNGVRNVDTINEYDNIKDSQLVACMLQGLESQFIMNLTIELYNNGYKVFSNEFDGVITNKPIDQSIIDKVIELTSFTRANPVIKDFI
jgi:hypothetical protein